jgi:MoxR-like ATPase
MKVTATPPLLRTLAESLTAIAQSGDAQALFRHLEGGGLPALGGDAEPAEVIVRALGEADDPPRLAAFLAPVLAQVIEQEAAVTPWEPVRELALRNALQLAADLPAGVSLASALRRLAADLEAAAEEFWLQAPLAPLVARALVYQQIDAAAEPLWFRLLEGSRDGPWTAERRTVLLSVWRGLLHVPPDGEAKRAGRVVDAGRIERGFLALNAGTWHREGGPRLIRLALRVLSETFPRSPQFWEERLGPYLGDWPAGLLEEVARQWPWLAKRTQRPNALELGEKIEKAGLPKEVKEKADQELKRLEAMPPVSAEATVSRNYIDWLVSVPWRKKSKERKDLDHAEKVLNEDHYGLEKIKDRILEFLAIRQLVGQSKRSIICFVGPPGVGKSSLAKSIARATGRKFVRLSLDGVRDEAEIRGHRRTYIGAFPGQIIQMMRKAGTTNPIFLLDEVDRMSTDFRGDPSEALLEALDPEQNDAFLDHYLDVDYDLSQVMFIATANVADSIPPPLKDRMEVIQLSGYTLNEKLAIAQQFLVPRQLKEHRLSAEKVKIEDEALKVLIEGYTCEAGVRSLESEIASICRAIASRVTREKVGIAVTVAPEMISELLGKPRFRNRRRSQEPEVGVANGLAWTEAGGELQETEVILMQGKGKLVLTGQGELMQQSARAAVSYLRSLSEHFGIAPDFDDSLDIHFHIPEGAIPRDVPAAGITLVVSLISALTRIPVRKDLAMTGEITLRGKVLSVDGIKDKVLAAYRGGITEVILPKENEKDLEEIPAEVREAMEVHLVEAMDEVLRLALDGPLSPLPKDLEFEERREKPQARTNILPH